MSSGKNTKKPSLEDLPLEVQEELKVQIHSLFFQNMQLTRLAWKLVQMQGGMVEVPLEEVPMLWSLKKEQGAQPNQLKLTSETLPVPPDQTIKALSEWLIGTKKDIRAGMIEFQLGEYPTPYIDQRLSIYVMEHPGDGWLSTQECIARTAPSRN